MPAYVLNQRSAISQAWSMQLGREHTQYVSAPHEVLYNGGGGPSAGSRQAAPDHGSQCFEQLFIAQRLCSSFQFSCVPRGLALASRPGITASRVYCREARAGRSEGGMH